MADIYDKIFKNLSKELPNSDDVELLKELLEIQRSQGPDGITNYLKKHLNDVGGD